MPGARRQHWIPPVALGTGQVAHGASWILLAGLAARQPFALGLAALAWLHLVALGWLTLTALAVLVHVIPAFTDAPWRSGQIARASLLVYAAGVVALVAAFWDGATGALPWASAIVACALLGYLFPAGRTLVAAYTGPRVEAAIARALTITLSALLVTVGIGVALALALAGRAPLGILSSGAPIHAAFGLFGWLSILIMGVSARTVRPITGNGSRVRWAHIAAGTLAASGVIVIALGVLLSAPPITWLGTIALSAGAVIYCADLADVLRRATVTHRPPQAFLAAGAVWFLTGLALAIGMLAGQPWGPAAIYVLLTGWIGQLVNAHIHHIGVRLIATIARGDDDETQPSELLTAPLSWATFGLFQCAVAAGAVGLGKQTPPLLEAAALLGFAGWLTLVANIAVAANRARRPQPPLDSRATISLLG
jgi:hypothetical protein